ncbi:AhpC/TSA family protein [Mucilaginibacter mali]|uniref:AhpC/TSA family protein n=1 Tax=Mucilaginibacter mali TaxID=2740462 RepID=A0A7D4QAA2_9SPHI|nr:TlpA disulfide reductase family protein [Mucilaginibacter mali]QKJ30665.1 AhpC/TSA family protein [Mucilaginibacter mali]
MKKIIVTCLNGLGLCLALGAQAQNLQYHINGKLQQIAEMPKKMYLSELIKAGILSKQVDSADVVNGEYHFSGQLTTDEAFAVSIAPKLKGSANTETINLIVDKGDIQVVSEKNISDFKVSGSGATAHHQFEDMRSKTKATSDSIKAMAASDGYKDDKALQAQVQSKSMKLLGQTIFDMYSYIKANPENRISPYGTFFLVQLPFLSPAGKDTLMSLLPAKVKGDKLGQAIVALDIRNKFVADSLGKIAAAKALENLSKIPLGSKELEFTQNDVNGKPISLSSFKGKYVLVDFWASWCAPCRAENPNVVKNYKQYKDKGFTILGVSLDGTSTKAAWLKAIQTDGLEWTQVSDLAGWNNSVAKLYEVKSIPQNFLIDPNGVIIGKNLRGEELSNKLATIFK